ncbi:MAG: hypothetical protein ACUZ8O_07615 [Candidatus Anammoxibacter sp.]
MIAKREEVFLLKDYLGNKDYRSGGVVIAITIVLILIIYALFSTSKTGHKLTRTMGQRTMTEAARERQEDMRERAAEGGANGNRHINIKQGQNLVVF